MKKLIIIMIMMFLSLSLTGGKEMGNKYIAVYGRDGEHISNIIVSKWTIIKNVYDLDTSNFEGYCKDDITEGLIFVFNDEYGNKEYSGFMKSIYQDEEFVSFKGEDFRKIFDTDILLDFTGITYDFEYELDNIFVTVKNEIIDQATTIFTLNFTIPTDTTYTMDIANYDGSYFITNALTFLKTYLAYYSYYLIGTFDTVNKDIEFEFVKNTTSYDIRLEDFIFDKISTEIKTNHTVATIKFNVNLQNKIIWINTTKSYFDAQVSENKDIVYYANDPSDYEVRAEQLNEGFALAIWDGSPTATLKKDYYKIAIANNKWGISEQAYFDAQASENKQIIESPDPSTSDPAITVPNIEADDYALGYAVKINYPAHADVYFRAIPNSTQRPDVLAEKHYYLGLDNQIYEDSIVEDKQIYPVITKIFENEYINKAQFNAIWELVNGRYNENIILTKTNSPIDILTFNLYDMIKVYDKEGNFKILPVTQIKYTENSYKVKLGFKKTRFTDIIKEATGTRDSGGGIDKNIKTSISRPVNRKPLLE